MPEVSVIGAGVTGLACACELIDRGIPVTVYERSAAIGPASCSWFAGGMLAPYCERDTAEESVTQSGLLAREWWERHVSTVTQRGSLVLSLPKDRNELKRLARLGQQCEWVNVSDIAQLEPDLQDFPGPGLWFPDEAHLDPRQTLRELVAYLKDRKVGIQFGEDVQSGDVHSEFVIDCRGYAARDELPGLRGVKGEMMILHSREINLSRPVRLLHPRQPIYLVPRDGRCYMLGATAIENDERQRVSVRSVVDLLNAALLLDARFGEAEVVETGVDVRPAFDDNLPKVLRKDHVIFVNGLFRHGFLLSPSLAMQVADAVMDSNHLKELPLCA